MSDQMRLSRNETVKRGRMILSVTVAGMALAACAGPNQTVKQAELAMESVRNDPNTERYAPVAVDRTEEALLRLKSAAANDEGQPELEHLAYLVEQRAAATSLRAKTVANREAVEQLGARRQQILIESEALEAEIARKETASALRDAQDERRRADALQEELNDLEARQTDRGLLVTIGDVLFDVDGAKLQPGGLEQIRRIADVLKSDPGRQVIIEGHTDSTGAEGYNLQLSEDRAIAVKAALTANGVSPDQISARGFGEAYPVATNEEKSGRQQNRRVELIIQDS